MTYCIGINLKSGILALSDTRITSGDETRVARKYKYTLALTISFFTSGLRSFRDKTITYFTEVFEKKTKNTTGFMRQSMI